MIIPALPADFDTVRSITQTTVSQIYPHYYPQGAVDFFLRHHSDESIASDIGSGCVFLCTDENGSPAGTVTVRKNEILRLFVLPEHQGKGLGRELLDFAEALVSEQYDEMIIDASLSAKPIYLKRGYREAEYHTIPTGNGDFLCYDVMKKRSTK
ncbi:MAG: GNAT family N-acetyltransferase [Ruminococcus sp.]|nr:GNAT family N-acetyltransferase [Ruminococcus sp.]